MISVIKVVLLWIVLVNFQHPSLCIVNRKRNNSSTIRPLFYPRRETYKQTSYLPTNRPLWILEDKSNRQGQMNVPIQMVRANKDKPRFIAPLISSSQFPSHYTHFNKPSTTMETMSTSGKRNRKNSKHQRVFPVFDNYGTDSDPVFIYRGAKAQMIFNTLMSSKKYPMQEPVPGQILYPPYSPKFKPTPVIERVPADNYADETILRNLTLIPFYTYEAAVDPRLGVADAEASFTNEVNTIQSTTESQLIPFYAYEAAVDPRLGVADRGAFFSNEVEKVPSTTESQSTVKENLCHNCYHSFYSQNDVQSKYWSLPQTSPNPTSTTPTNLRQQIEVSNEDQMYRNHRIDDTSPISPSDEPFRINYESDTKNPLTKKRFRSVLSAKYGGFKTVYPIYTLNKLLRYKPFKSENKDAVADGDTNKLTAPEKTWLVWNSRNREAHKSNYLNSLSIKDMPKNHKLSRMLDHKLMIK